MYLSYKIIKNMETIGILTTVDTNSLYSTNSICAGTHNHSPNLKYDCTELYKQLLWYNLRKFGKDTISEEQHKNMLSMLNSNDDDTLELLRQILIGKAIE